MARGAVAEVGRPPRVRVSLLLLAIVATQPVGIALARPVWPRESGWLIFFVANGIAANLIYAVVDRAFPRHR